VDNDYFYWMGPGQKAVQKDMTVRTPRLAWVLLDAKCALNPSKFTSTKTIITMTCGGVDVTATFLSPIEVRTQSVTQI
jgi:hypothetical protein